MTQMNRILGICFYVLWTFAGSSPAQPAAPQPGKPVVLPTRYEEATFYAEPVTTSGVKLNLFTDSGGGLFFFSNVTDQLGLKAVTNSTGDATPVVPWPQFKPGEAIPPPTENDGKMPVMPDANRPPVAKEWSGMLGQEWFAGRIWTWDYPARQLLWRADGDVPDVAVPHRASLG